MRVVWVGPAALIQLKPLLVDPLREAPVLGDKLVVMVRRRRPRVVCLVPLVVVGVRIDHALIEPPLCPLQGAIGCGDLLLQDGERLSLLGHVGGHEVVPVGLG